jgi:acyl-CoA thioesterase FadM
MLTPGGAAQTESLARRFAFTEIPLPDPRGAAHPRSIRPVNPSLRRIDAWISSVGAGIAVGDLDGNGVDDDLCHVDPRFDSVTVEPLPGTGARYKQIPLRTGRGLDDPATMAPTGCLPVDAMPDGRMELIVYYWGRTPLLFTRTATGDNRPRQIVDGGVWNTNTMTSADVDGDGHPDLVVGNYHVSCDYYAELRALDTVIVRMTLAQVAPGRVSMRFDYVRGEELVARGTQEIACLRAVDGTHVRVPVPEALRAALGPHQEEVGA